MSISEKIIHRSNLGIGILEKLNYQGKHKNEYWKDRKKYNKKLT